MQLTIFNQAVALNQFGNWTERTWNSFSIKSFILSQVSTSVSGHGMIFPDLSQNGILPGDSLQASFTGWWEIELL